MLFTKNCFSSFRRSLVFSRYAVVHAVISNISFYIAGKFVKFNAYYIFQTCLELVINNVSLISLRERSWSLFIIMMKERTLFTFHICVYLGVGWFLHNFLHKNMLKVSYIFHRGVKWISVCCVTPTSPISPAAVVSYLTSFPPSCCQQFGSLFRNSCCSLNYPYH